jgi:hypothetical protein
MKTGKLQRKPSQIGEHWTKNTFTLFICDYLLEELYLENACTGEHFI